MGRQPATPTTPDLLGYLLAYVLTVALFPLPIGLYVLGSDPGSAGSLEEAAAVWVIFALYGAFVSVPFALVGIPLVHLAAHGRQRQSTHVLITGLVSTGLVWVVIGALVQEALSPLVLAAPVGLAAAAGRAAVIPLVHRRQRTADSARPRVRC